MFIQVHSAVVSGPTVQPVTVEVASSRSSLPTISLIGLPNASVMESKDRVFSALRSLGVELPRKRIVISLRPVEVPKSGSSLDLAIALGVLMVQGLIPLQECAAIGELGLDGSLHAGPEYPALLRALSGSRKTYVPAEFLQQRLPAVLLHNGCFAVTTLRELYLASSNQSCLLPVRSQQTMSSVQSLARSVGGIVVSAQLLRVVTIALAGGHHTLFFGSPGVGKTYARRLVEKLLPDETSDQADERYIRESLWRKSSELSGRVVAPHHSASLAGLVGGGSTIHPGAISWAHQGILFLDELPEFTRACLEALRQPLETENITLIRGAGSWILPCSFTLIATANPCPCGYYGTNICSCRDQKVDQYREHISGPILDRIDLQLRVTPHDRQKFKQDELVRLQTLITQARRKQEERMSRGMPEYSRLYERQHLEALGCTFVNQFPKRLMRGWSVRRWMKLWRVAQTIADLESGIVEEKHLLEAFSLVRPAFGETTPRPEPP